VTWLASPMHQFETVFEELESKLAEPDPAAATTEEN
jgi:hypothetical protein